MRPLRGDTIWGRRASRNSHRLDQCLATARVSGVGGVIVRVVENGVHRALQRSVILVVPLRSGTAHPFWKNKLQTHFFSGTIKQFKFNNNAYTSPIKIPTIKKPSHDRRKCSTFFRIATSAYFFATQENFTPPERRGSRSVTPGCRIRSAPHKMNTFGHPTTPPPLLAAPPHRRSLSGVVRACCRPAGVGIDEERVHDPMT